MSKKTTKAQAVDARLFQQIQPHGGITFADPSYTRMGDGYCRCLHIYGLPNTLDRHWLTRIFTVSGCICSFDVATEDMAAVKRSINRSIGEEGARAYDAKDYNALYDAQKRQAELQQLYDELERMGEVMKICDFRIFLQAQMLAELEEKTKELQDNLDASGYKNTVLLGEQKTEWQSLYEPFAVTHAKPVTMKGLSLTARQLAEGYPFDYSDLLDEQGALLGFTDMGGAVVFDLFSKTVKRKHYNAAVCGDMGSGKSTLLKVISGVYKPSAGKVTVNGTIAPLIELGAGFDMDLTARENIYLNGTVLGYTPKYIDSKFDDIVEFSELQDFLDVPLKNYSSGMVARLAFAVATITKPDILIADEILSVGDFLFQEKCEKRMAELLSGGTTVILVSHSIDQIERMCNKVAWLDHGHLRRIGATKEITAEYRRFEKKDAMPAKVTEE